MATSYELGPDHRFRPEDATRRRRQAAGFGLLGGLVGAVSASVLPLPQAHPLVLALSLLLSVLVAVAVWNSIP